MSFGKSSSGSGFQILCESSRSPLRSELHGHDEQPRPALDSLTTQSGVVPLKFLTRVRRNTDVVTPCIGLASQDVDDPFLVDAHGILETHEMIRITSILLPARYADFEARQSIAARRKRSGVEGTTTAGGSPRRADL